MAGELAARPDRSESVLRLMQYAALWCRVQRALHSIVGRSVPPAEPPRRCQSFLSCTKESADGAALARTRFGNLVAYSRACAEARFARSCAVMHEGPDRGSSPGAAAEIGLFVCGLTFELKPTAEVGSVSLVRDDARVPRTRLALPAVVGRRLERGVRPHLASVPGRGRSGAANHEPNSTPPKMRSCWSP